MNITFSQWLSIQTDAHQQLLQECELILHSKMMVISCHDQETAAAVSEAMPLLVDGLQVLGVNRIQVIFPGGIADQLTVGAAKMMQRRAFDRLARQLDAIC